MSDVKQYRKKPVIIEAWQRTGDKENDLELLKWATSYGGYPIAIAKKPSKDAGKWFVQTLEGALEISIDDWLIKGIKGEFYPCKPDIFEKTYEALSFR